MSARTPLCRRFRFRLRTLLVVMLLAGVALAAVYRAQEQQRSVQALAAVNPGAAVLYDYQLDAAGEIVSRAAPGPPWLRQQLGVDYLSDVAGVDVFYPTDADLRCLVRFPRLRRVNLQRAVDLTDAGLESLVGMRQLKLLVIREADQLSDAGLATIGRITSLQELELEPSRRMTAFGLERLKESLPHCRITFAARQSEDELAAF